MASSVVRRASVGCALLLAGLLACDGEVKTSEGCKSFCVELHKCDMATWGSNFMVQQDCWYACNENAGNTEFDCWVTCDATATCDDWNACRTKCSSGGGGTTTSACASDLSAFASACSTAFQTCATVLGIPASDVPSMVASKCATSGTPTAADCCTARAARDYYACVPSKGCVESACQAALQAALAACGAE